MSNYVEIFGAGLTGINEFLKEQYLTLIALP